MSEASIFYVAPGTEGRWDVREHGFDKAIAYFEAKQEAIDYATKMAKTKVLCQVKVMNENGTVEFDQTYHGEASK